MNFKHGVLPNKKKEKKDSFGLGVKGSPIFETVKENILCRARSLQNKEIYSSPDLVTEFKISWFLWLDIWRGWRTIVLKQYRFRTIDLTVIQPCYFSSRFRWLWIQNNFCAFICSEIDFCSIILFFIFLWSTTFWLYLFMWPSI